MRRFLYIHTFVLICTLVCVERTSFANDTSASTQDTGAIGLNTIPTARMDKFGTMRAGVSTSGPYNHAFLGLQIATPLSVHLRQSMLISSVGDKPDRVYPGMDIKLRLANEGRYRPAIAFGANSLLGHKRFSSEYFALSKRYYDFDFTGGVAWGRMGSNGHIKNPFANFSSHFDQNRDLGAEDSASPSDWFTGEEIGFFGGIEYFTPLHGLSLKADFNADAYNAERANFGFESPSPWSFGFNYSPSEWISFGASIIGADMMMARLSFQGDVLNIKKALEKDKDDFPYMPAEFITTDNGTITGNLPLNDYESSTMQIGRAAKELSARADPSVKTIRVVPMMNGTKGKAMTFSRTDIQKLAKDMPISPEEIWHSTEFSDDHSIDFSQSMPRTYKLAPELSFSLGEEETSHLYRATLNMEEEKQWGYGIVTGNSITINAADNLHRIAKFRDINLDSIRSDIDLYTKNHVNVKRSFLSFLNTPLPDFHVAATAGYLEEMFAGYGGEILYRPHQSPFAIGAEMWNVYKRDPLSPMALELYGDAYNTGFLNVYYDVPGTPITAFAKGGKFIGGDYGVNTGAQMKMSNGMTLKGSVSITNDTGKDVFNSDRNMQAGLELTIPFGYLKFVPNRSAATFKSHQMGRDDAAIIDKPIDLYDVTEPTSYHHLGQNWQEVQN